MKFASLVCCVLLSVGGAGLALPAQASLRVPTGFSVTVIAHVAGAHGLAFLPNGDLLVGSEGSTVSLLPQADGAVRAPHTFASFPDSPAYGVATADSAIYVATQSSLWRVPYRAGEPSASAPSEIAKYRRGAICAQ